MQQCYSFSAASLLMFSITDGCGIGSAGHRRCSFNISAQDGLFVLILYCSHCTSIGKNKCMQSELSLKVAEHGFPVLLILMHLPLVQMIVEQSRWYPPLSPSFIVMILAFMQSIPLSHPLGEKVTVECLYFEISFFRLYTRGGQPEGDK